jgi:hypothetical protein
MQVALPDSDPPGVLVKAEIARRQMDAERGKTDITGSFPAAVGAQGVDQSADSRASVVSSISQPKRFHGSVALDAARVGRDASRIADEVIAHLTGLIDAKVKVTLEVEAEIASGAPDSVVRTVTENARTLRFNTHGFEKE